MHLLVLVSQTLFFFLRINLGNLRLNITLHADVRLLVGNNVDELKRKRHE